jgi:glutathione S-transferase
MSVVLWHIEISHYNEKVRFALAYKDIAHERRVPIPGLHGFSAMRVTRSSHRRLPVLKLDGRRIGDTTAIIAALEEYKPDPPLYPADPMQRARALELEDFFDEHLGHHVRAFVFASLFASGADVGPILAPGGPRVVQRLLTASTPLAKPIVRADYGARDERVAEHVTAIRAAMDRLESEIQPSGYLAGEAFSVADLTAASLFTPLLDPPGREHMPPVSEPVLELREELRRRPGAAWVDEIFARHR